MGNTTQNVEIPDRPDVSSYQTAAGAAKATYKALQEWAEFYGADPEGVTLHNPEETALIRDNPGYGVWTVSWEGGPHQWAPALTGGEWLGWNEHGGSGEPEVTGLLDGDGFAVECYYSFDIQFFNY